MREREGSNARLNRVIRLRKVPGASHSFEFEEPGEVAFTTNVQCTTRFPLRNQIWGLGSR